MIKNKPLQPYEISGVYTAIITPMREDDPHNRKNSIDDDKLFQLINDQINAGVNGIVIAGTTGQSTTLDDDEQVHLVRRVYDEIRAKFGEGIQIIVGAGSNCTRDAINLSQRIEEEIGPSTFLHVTGYYNNPPQEGLIAHFQDLAESLPRSNILMYDVPGRTSSRIEPDTVIELSKYPGIIGIKEASGALALESAKKIIEATDRQKFVILSGEDELVESMMSMGGAGVISASANVAPKYFVEIAKAESEEDYAQARKLQDEVNPLIKAVFSAKNPIPLAHMFNTALRKPLVKLPRIQAHLDSILANYSPEKLGVDLRNYQ